MTTKLQVQYLILTQKYLKKFNVNQTDAKFELFKNNYSVYLVKGNINDIDLANSEFEINKENKNFNVKGNLVSRANLKNIQKLLICFKSTFLKVKWINLKFLLI